MNDIVEIGKKNHQMIVKHEMKKKGTNKRSVKLLITLRLLSSISFLRFNIPQQIKVARERIVVYCYCETISGFGGDETFLIADERPFKFSRLLIRTNGW